MTALSSSARTETARCGESPIAAAHERVHAGFDLVSNDNCAVSAASRLRTLEARVRNYGAAENKSLEIKTLRPRRVPRDSTLVAWYPSLYAPRTGGAYDSHHRTAGIAGRTRRRGGGLAARDARATVGDAGDRISRSRFGAVRRLSCDRVSARLE